jgi:hypothetical protein
MLLVVSVLAQQPFLALLSRQFIVYNQILSTQLLRHRKVALQMEPQKSQLQVLQLAGLDLQQRM